MSDITPDALRTLADKETNVLGPRHASIPALRAAADRIEALERDGWPAEARAVIAQQALELSHAVEARDKAVARADALRHQLRVTEAAHIEAGALLQDALEAMASCCVGWGESMPRWAEPLCRSVLKIRAHLGLDNEVDDEGFRAFLSRQEAEG